MGPDTGMLQAMDQHQEAAGEKGGFGLGHSDSIATITEGLKWFFTFFEGAIAAYNNVFEGLVSGSSLATLFGKSGNMFGIKIFEALAEFFSGGGGGEGGDGGAPQDDGGGEHDPSNHPNFNDQMGHDFNDFAGGGAHHEQDYSQGQSFSPGPSPSVGDDHDHGAALGG
ncbi:hypothetical protein [Wolbachia endosymbiont of Folsomia candida]|uniref:hypothetical protein n=1 Tax=Wolbachia endosymbiont of Folsomia candida TaxID=169402 RepID=UPI000B038296|nr:hypothetical protein [Wolbachia endosymbiont of Folsomia candida]APR98812.1 hypothetical protein ASM33_06315 [Wolbachia endosymbiont of Folsomia candida]